MSLPPPDIEAEIRFLTTDEGGRQTGVTSGYRPHHDFGLEGTQVDAAHVYDNNEWVHPGETVIAGLAFPPITQEHLVGRLQEGLEFTVQEGARIVGRGRVTQILNQALIATET